MTSLPIAEAPVILRPREWERLCRQCGACCFEKDLLRNGRYAVRRSACRYLDIVSRRCRVYHKRFATGEECLRLTPQVVRAADWLPEECGYRQFVEVHAEIQLLE